MRLDAGIAAALAGDFATLALLHDAELSPTLAAELRDIGFPSSLALVPHGDAACGSREMMRQAVGALPAPGAVDAFDEIAADYASIYLTAAHGVSPSESYWLSDDHLVCQEPMFELRALYAARGLAAPDWRSRPDDHLVLQLQFLARRLEAIAGDDDWRELAGFLDLHLLRWMPDFAARVADRCDTMFYAALSLLTDAWLQQLRDLIAEHLGNPRPTREQVEAQLAARGDGDAPAAPLRFFPGAAGPSW